MSFLALERRGAPPVEGYTFHRGSTGLYHFTSSDIARNIDVLAPFSYTGGDVAVTYSPVPIRREQVEGSDERAGAALRVTIATVDPDTSELASLFLDGMPTSPIELSLYRSHRGNRGAARVFYGDVMAAEVAGGQVVLSCEPKTHALKHAILRQLWQGPCNNQLYDTFCGVNKAGFAVAGTVGTITSDGLTITVSAASAFADGYFAAGGLLEFGSRRGTLIAHIGDTLTLFRAVPGLVVSSSVTVYPGCDRALGTCHGTFSNSANHMGFPFIPVRNPFTTGVD